MFKHGQKLCFTLYIDQEIRDGLERLSKLKKISMCDVIRETLMEKIKKEFGDGSDNKNKQS